jgi:hypothetical protein
MAIFENIRSGDVFTMEKSQLDCEIHGIRTEYEVF